MKAALQIWRLGYALEEKRQLHAARGHLLREAGCCLALFVARWLGRLS